MLYELLTEADMFFPQNFYYLSKQTWHYVYHVIPQRKIKHWKYHEIQHGYNV